MAWHVEAVAPRPHASSLACVWLSAAGCEGELGGKVQPDHAAQVGALAGVHQGLCDVQRHAYLQAWPARVSDGTCSRLMQHQQDKCTRVLPGLRVHTRDRVGRPCTHAVSAEMLWTSLERGRVLFMVETADKTLSAPVSSQKLLLLACAGATQGAPAPTKAGARQRRGEGETCSLADQSNLQQQPPSQTLHLH